MAQYEIWIRARNDEGEKKSPIAGGKGKVKKVETPEEKSLKARKAGVRAYVAIKRNIAPFISASLDYSISTISLRTGRVERQQRTEFWYGIAKQGAGIVENIAIGALVGGAAGAITGAIASVAQTALSYGFQYSKLRTGSNLENISLALMDVRAGGSTASYDQSRTTK